MVRFYAWSMGFADVSASDVLETIREFDRLGREAFLARYGFGEATRFYLIHEGRRYDSKAIVGVAHQVRHGRPLRSDEFSGGEQTVIRHLRLLGFTVQSGRNPDWNREEVILACALLATNDWHYLNAHDPRVAELSHLLQQLVIHPVESRGPDFRNTNGVARKTADIATQHPGYRGKPTNGGRHDKPVLLEFLAHPAEMMATAQAIRESAAEEELQRLLPADLDLEESADEGHILERKHLARERDPKLRARKIGKVRQANGRVACEACGFDFAETYGERGTDYIECHHRVPLHASGPTTTRLIDLVLLCSNCHRMIHRTTPWLTVEELCTMIDIARARPVVASTATPTL